MKRKWQFALILAVVVLTLYNVLPTVLYYANPLRSPVSPSQAAKIASSIEQRVDRMEEETRDWLSSYCRLLSISPLSIAPDPESPLHFIVSFAKSEDAAKLRKWLPRAGAMIPFTPAQLTALPSENRPKEVVVMRRLSWRLSEIPADQLFTHVLKRAEQGITPQFLALANDRVGAVQESLKGKSPYSLVSLPEGLEESLHTIKTIETLYATEKEFAVRYARWLAAGQPSSQNLIQSLERARDSLQQSKENSRREEKIAEISRAEQFVKKHPSLFEAATAPANPFFTSIALDEQVDSIRLVLFPDLKSARIRVPLVEQLLIDAVATVQRETEESLEAMGDGFFIPLHKRSDCSGFLVFNLDRLAAFETERLVRWIEKEWRPTHPDLSSLKVVSSDQYALLSPQDQALCIVITAPAAESSPLSSDLRRSSIYAIVKGIGKVVTSYQQNSSSETSRLFMQEFQQLATLLAQQGYAGYPASLFQADPLDFVFENRHFAAPLLAATREEFRWVGNKKKALLELSDWEQRILAQNQIETEIHEELLKWADDYRNAQVSLNAASRYDVPKPTHSPFWSNLALTARKYIRGDERKIIRWGLDLSGGKTVQIELRDANNQPVRDPASIKQGINELFERVNKMGVADVSIRQVGYHIALDFPGGQALSASELVKASSMLFHIVNERFSPSNPQLGPVVHRFLQAVWNEASVRGKTDPESVRAIAYRHLHGEEGLPGPLGDAAQTLWNEGLRLADPKRAHLSQSLDLSLSKIALLRGDNPSEWQGMSHPLIIVMNSFALEGGQLDNIRASYDPSKGNFLSFEVKTSEARTRLHEWTSLFCKDRIGGTEFEASTRGRGWRMAVLLNDRVISAPTLESALRDSASITGTFTQREIQQLSSDLKAGSLSFTPHILSEQNVSPELGKAERDQGIRATLIAFALVIGSMVLYYRFAGLVASVAVVFNLLILWAVLQNLGASLSLAGIAGIILTVGMAVDANVLVFERFKEEFGQSRNVASALRAGYDKAFSAILDSNVTTIIAALILLNFDAGPIKAFAVSMIIGIASSMFTALFMTRYYFEGWIAKKESRTLSMAHWIGSTSGDFLKYAKPAFIVALTLIGVGIGALFTHRTSALGMDFTGGYALHIELDDTPEGAARAEQALIAAGATKQDFQIRQYHPETQLRILLGTSLEQPNHPFHGMPLESEGTPGSPHYLKNPRIAWVVDALQSSGLSLTPACLDRLESNWTSMSGQMSESMRNQAVIGLLIAFVAIFIYIAIRFEYKYAISASLCLLHDVLVTVGIIGILHALGAPVQIDLNTLAALMTIIGYSLNDTIIVFDRIREDTAASPRSAMTLIINHALNATLSRTTITSGTTLLVVLAMALFGGSSIFTFSLVMVIGIVVGTLSSWFIAAPLLLFFHKKEENKAIEARA
jgi:SecD/SecF fusion protein